MGRGRNLKEGYASLLTIPQYQISEQVLEGSPGSERE
jgi:hypothetical protein